MSDEEVPSKKQPAFLSEDEMVYFSNCLGLSMQASKFRSIVETPKRRKDFQQSGYLASPDMIGLMFLWNQHNQWDRHYMADVIRVCDIIRKELGYATILEYIETRGWLIKKTRSTAATPFTLEYRKIQESLPKDPNGKRTTNLIAMVEAMYSQFDTEHLRDPFTHLPCTRPLPMNSFISKLNSHSQDMQAAIVVTKVFFVEFAPTNQGDVTYWMLIIFRDCSSRKEFVCFIHQVLSLHSDGVNGELSRELLTDYTKCVKDRVATLAASAHHFEAYDALVEDLLHAKFGHRGTDPNRDVSEDRQILLLRARFKDLNSQYFADPEKKKAYRSSTKRKIRNKKRKATESK
jgi:hypothetical protein